MTPRPAPIPVNDMPSALTRSQLEALRRTRDLGSPFAGPRRPDVPREVGFLLAIELLCISDSGALALTELGERYLAAAELEMASPTIARATGALRAFPGSRSGSSRKDD